MYPVLARPLFAFCRRALFFWARRCHRRPKRNTRSRRASAQLFNIIYSVSHTNPRTAPRSEHKKMQTIRHVRRDFFRRPCLLLALVFLVCVAFLVPSTVKLRLLMDETIMVWLYPRQTRYRCEERTANRKAGKTAGHGRSGGDGGRGAEGRAQPWQEGRISAFVDVLRMGFRNFCCDLSLLCALITFHIYIINDYFSRRCLRVSPYNHAHTHTYTHKHIWQTVKRNH